MTVWNRIQTVASTTTTTLIQTPAELLPRHHRRRRNRQRRFDLGDELLDDPDHPYHKTHGHNHHQDRADNHHGQGQDQDHPHRDRDTRFWQESFENHLNILAVADDAAPYRYEIHRGKAVPSPTRLTGSRDNLPSDVPVNVNGLPQLNSPHRRLQSESSLRPAADKTDGADGSLTHHPRSAHSRHESEALTPTPPSTTATPPPLGKMYAYGRRNADAHGVSPPSSPEINYSQPSHLDHDVSPIDDDVGMSQQRMLKGARPTQAPSGIPPPRPSSRQPSGQQPKSSIPTMRRERRKQQEAATASAHKPRRPNQREQHGRQTPPVAVPSPNSNQTPVGWHDPAGGRLTPTYSPPFDDDSQGYGVSTTITSHTSREAQTPSPSLGHRIRQFGKGKPEPIENRPAWNGASGRQTLVEPVRDDTNVAPLSIPPKSSRRDDRAQGSRVRNNNPTSSRESETSYGQPDPSNTGRRAVPPRTGQTPEPDRSPITESATHYATQSAQPYPSPPTRSSPAPQTQPTAAPRSNRNSPPPPLVIPDRDKAIKRKPPPSHAVHPSTSSSIYSTQPPEGPGLTAPSDAVNTASLKHPVSGEGWVQPSSRFSVTTYATSATGSPRQSQESEQPPVPKVPSTASVMDRGKPVRGKESPSTSGDDPLVISLRPASGANAVTGHGYEKKPRRTATDIMKSERSASISSTSKALPPAPPEMVESKDRVVVLNAKLEALAHRRNNITRSIKQMTELMPADRLMESAEVLRKREEEKKKVENLKEELAEIQQQEYDLGLKLHRAYKRQEREAGYESGTLWVRRFTE